MTPHPRFGLFLSQAGLSWHEVLDRFRLADDSRDANGRLDLSSVKLLSIVAAWLEKGPVATNTISLDEPGFALHAATGTPP